LSAKKKRLKRWVKVKVENPCYHSNNRGGVDEFTGMCDVGSPRNIRVHHVAYTRTSAGDFTSNTPKIARKLRHAFLTPGFSERSTLTFIKENVVIFKCAVQKSIESKYLKHASVLASILLSILYQHLINQTISNSLSLLSKTVDNKTSQ